MKELSLNILDIAENSVKAGATLTEILIDETEDTVTITIKDNGCGMTQETVKAAQDPFYTTRTTRSVGMGIPLFKLGAEQTGGSLTLVSRHKDEFPEDHGTVISASFHKNHLDFTPLGDVAASITTLIQGHPDTDFEFHHKKGSGEVALDTRQIREILGDDVSLAEYEVVKWLEEYLKEQYSQNN
jgi:hypothetical protein